MEMVEIRFLNEEDRERGVIDLAKQMRVIGLRGKLYVIPAAALQLLDEWACQYEIVERGGYDLLVASPRSPAAGKV